MKGADLQRYTVPVEGPLAFVRSELVLPDGRRVGDASGPDGWIERDLLRPVFARDAAGLPAHRLVYLELPRGHWKSGGGAAIAVTEAVLHPSTDVVVVAADRDQAAIVAENIDGYLARNPSLRGSFRRAGDEYTVPSRGSRIRVISSDVASSWGLGGTHRRFRLIADELTVWPSGQGEQLWGSLISATGKTPDAQMIVLSNAGFDRDRSWQWRVRESAEREPWAYLFSAPGVIASWVTEAWLEQMRTLLPGPAYARVIENKWTSGSGDFVTAEQWRLCVDDGWRPQTRAEPGRSYFAGLDLGLVKDATALAVVHVDGDGCVRLDELRTWQGRRGDPVDIAAVERAIVDVSERFAPCRVSADPWQLSGSIQRLSRAGVDISEHVFSASSVAKLSTTLYSLITGARLRVYDDAELEREVLGLQTVLTASGWRVDHRAGGYSDRAMALAMAALTALGDRGAPGEAKQYCGFCGRPSCDSVDCDSAAVTERAGMTLIGERYIDRPSPR